MMAQADGGIYPSYPATSQRIPQTSLVAVQISPPAQDVPLLLVATEWQDIPPQMKWSSWSRRKTLPAGQDTLCCMVLTASCKPATPYSILHIPCFGWGGGGGGKKIKKLELATGSSTSILGIPYTRHLYI